jgi:peptide/nickel transport system substrate-binding protein
MRAKAIIFVTICFLIFGCKGGQRQSHQVFYYNEPAGIASLDPAFAKNQSIIWAVHQLYNTLVETDAQLNIVPALAKSWEVSNDRLQYTFHLRDSVFFHDNEAFAGGRGRQLKAADIVFSFQRLIDPATASPGAWIFNGRVAASHAFEAPNDSTFVLTLARPFSPILGVLSNVYCSIVPREVVAHFGTRFRSHPCGTGPFRFDSWEEGQSLIFLRNEHYFERDSSGQALPYLDAVKISFYDSKATEFLLFRQGKLDFINDIDPSFKDEVLTKKGALKKDWKGKIILQKHAYLNTEYLGILMDSSSPLLQNSPLRLKKVRQAINYGFDRRKMMLYLRNSVGIPAESGFVPAGLPSFDSSKVKGYTYNPDKARQLLKEAGFEKGIPGPPIKLLTVAIYSDFGSYIARELEAIGLKVQVEIVPKSLLLEQTAQSTALFFRGSWIADYPDAENFLSVFYGKNPAPPNYTRYHNPLYDSLYEKALQAESDSARYSQYQKMDQLMINDAPVVPLWYDEVIHLVNKRVSGFEANGLNLLELRHTRVSAATIAP